MKIRRLAMMSLTLYVLGTAACSESVGESSAMEREPNDDYDDSNSGPIADSGHREGSDKMSGAESDWDAVDGELNAGDSYEDVGTNPFVLTAHDPFSTFAADVDSASYDIFRRDINYGALPQPRSVRLEEYVNYFKYDYPAPAAEDDQPFQISLDASSDLFGNGTVLLRVGIQGMLPPAREKKPANLVFLIDTSGSMTSMNKLPLVQRLLTSTLGVLDPTDKVSIVTYAGSTGVRLEPTEVAQKAEIEDVISSLQSGGSTAGAAGIDLAYKQAEAGFIEGGINHVILCTDGDFNVGPSSDDALVSLIEEKRKSGITLTVLGFGIGNLNDSMMEKISNAGNGIYGVISSTSQADEYVEHRLLSNLVLIAKDMKIQVEFNPEQVKAYRLLGYENRAIADDDFRDDTVDGGEVGAGHRVTALYELVRPGNEIPAPQGAPELDQGDPVEGDREIAPSNLVMVKVRYKEVDATEEDPAREVREIMEGAQIRSSYQQMDESFRWAVAIAAFAEILKESPYANRDALPEIEGVVKEKTWLDGDRSEFVGLFDRAMEMMGY